MTQEMKSIEDRGRQAADALVTAFRRGSSLRSTDQKSAEQVEMEKLRHERDLLVSERDAAHAQLHRAADFCNQVRFQAQEHQDRMMNEAHQLCQHVAHERRELLSSCNRKADETVNMLKSQLEAEKANVEQVVSRQLQSESEKMARDVQAQQEVLLGNARAEFERAQQELDGLRAHAEAAERERDASMQQLAAEKIRSAQMQSQGAQLKYEKDTLFTQLVDLRHAALNGACQDIQWTANREPEGFSVYVDQVVNSTDAGIHVVPPFASQPTSVPPGLDKVDEVNEPAPQTPENRRTQHSSSSPVFGLFANMDGSRGSGSNRMGADSTPDR
eukprot:810523-Amphidinium_carterae.1